MLQVYICLFILVFYICALWGFSVNSDSKFDLCLQRYIIFLISTQICTQPVIQQAWDCHLTAAQSGVPRHHVFQQQWCCEDVLTQTSLLCWVQSRTFVAFLSSLSLSRLLIFWQLVVVSGPKRKGRAGSRSRCLRTISWDFRWLGRKFIWNIVGPPCFN